VAEKIISRSKQPVVGVAEAVQLAIHGGGFDSAPGLRGAGNGLMLAAS
jgi:hypothetical protein